MTKTPWPSETAVSQDRHGQGLPCTFCASRVPDIEHASEEHRHAIVHETIICRQRCLPVIETILIEEPDGNQIRTEHKALIKIYVLAARLRTFPVPFDDHFALVGAVDECRAVLEPQIDDGPGTTAPKEISAWQERVAAYPREEFLTALREAQATLHRLWTAQVGKEGYDKSQWKVLDNALARFARDAAENVGITRSEPLL